MWGLLLFYGVCEFVSLFLLFFIFCDVEKYSFEMNYVICIFIIGNWILVCDGGGMVGKWYGIWWFLKKFGMFYGYNYIMKELWFDELWFFIYDYWDLLLNKSLMEKCLIVLKWGNKGLMLNMFMYIN